MRQPTPSPFLSRPTWTGQAVAGAGATFTFGWVRPTPGWSRMPADLRPVHLEPIPTALVVRFEEPPRLLARAR